MFYGTLLSEYLKEILNDIGVYLFKIVRNILIPSRLFKFHINIYFDEIPCLNHTTSTYKKYTTSRTTFV